MAVWTLDELVSISKVSKSTLNRARRAGRLNSRKVGDRVLITEEDWHSFLDSCSTTRAAAVVEGNK
jgi:hypothetical protein